MDTCETNRYGQIDTIDWQMMDKKRFLVYSLGNVVILRSFLYPLTVIKTNLQVFTFGSRKPVSSSNSSVFRAQVQKSHQVYDGAFHAFRKIVGQEGFKGLYRGFMVNSIQVISGCAYILTLEKMRDVCTTTFDIRDNALKGLIAGGLSSMVSQTINTPFDVVSQHLMLLNKQKSSLEPNAAAANNRHLNSHEKASRKIKVKPLSIDTRSLTRFQINLAVIRQLYKTDGPAGFYRGYFASLVQYIPRYSFIWKFSCFLSMLSKAAETDLSASVYTGGSQRKLSLIFTVIGDKNQNLLRISCVKHL